MRHLSITRSQLGPSATGMFFHNPLNMKRWDGESRVFRNERGSNKQFWVIFGSIFAILTKSLRLTLEGVLITIRHPTDLELARNTLDLPRFQTLGRTKSCLKINPDEKPRRTRSCPPIVSLPASRVAVGQSQSDSSSLCRRHLALSIRSRAPLPSRSGAMES